MKIDCDYPNVTEVRGKGATCAIVSSGRGTAMKVQMKSRDKLGECEREKSCTLYIYPLISRVRGQYGKLWTELWPKREARGQ